MSLASRILGIPGLEVERVDWNTRIDVWAKPNKRPNCLYCGSSQLRIKASQKRTVKHSRQGNRVVMLHLTAPKYHCQQCDRYFNHRFTGIRPRFRASEGYRLEVFEAHDGGVTQRKLSNTHSISPATVERWYRYHTEQKLSECSNRTCPEVLGIDEHFFTRKKGFATTFVDLGKHHVFDIQLGRSESSLRRYLKALPNKGNVKVMVMDLSETYRSIARRYFPNATIVADRFHVVRLINHHFLNAWKLQDPEGRKSRGLLSLMRRHEWRLRDEQREKLGRYLDDYPALKALYKAKQKLVRFVLLKMLTARRMRNKLPGFLKLIEQLRDSPLRALAKTLESWLQPIVAMWRFTKNNGITEGFHTKMEMMSRRAYGFRNFDNYRMRVMAHCGWDGIINRV